MFIILSIHSKNFNSLTNFLKFFYKLNTNKILKLKFYSIQSQQKDKFSFFSTLQSPHVNKKSQEQFEYSLHHKRLKIHASQMIKFLTIWNIIKMRMFLDIKIEIEFWVQKKSLHNTLLTKLDCDRFKQKFYEKRNFIFITKRFNRRLRKTKCFHKKIKKKQSFFSFSPTPYTFLKLLDIHGEILIKKTSKV